MQREEITATIGPLTVRLIQRPAQVPPEFQPIPCCEPPGTTAQSCPETQQIEAQPQSAAGPPLQPADCLLGWELWPAAWRLAAYLASGHGAELVRRAEAVVELGAGLGLPGIVAAMLGAKSVTLTDLPQALPLLTANVLLNGVGNTCHAAALDWGTLAAATAAARPSADADEDSAAGGGSLGGYAGCGSPEVEGPLPARKRGGLNTASCGRVSGGGHTGAYDVVLAADVVYVSSLVPLLADSIAAVCRSSSAVVLVGHTVRKSVWLDRKTGTVCVDATDEPWIAFMSRMTQVHGFKCTGHHDGDSAITASGGAEVTLPSNTFVCVFERHLG